MVGVAAFHDVDQDSSPHAVKYKKIFLCVMKWMTPRSHVAVQHGHLPFIFPFSTSWLTSHLVCEIYQILLDIYLAYSSNIQVQVSD
jgi:hypothetical protein